MRLVVLTLLIGLIPACGTPPSASAPARHDPAGPIALDGRFDDWPAGVQGLADGEHLYFRLRLDETTTLQAATRTYALLVDMDGDAATGEPADGLGTDVEVLFSPFRRGQTSGRGQAAQVILHDADGASQISHAQVGLLFAPTHSAGEFEIRLDRWSGGDEAGQDVRARFVTRDPSGATLASSSVIEIPTTALPEAGDPAATIPLRGYDELRIVTLNVEYANSVKNPKPFGRVLRALNPDIVLIQEWDKGDEYQIRDWFREHVPPASGWQCLRSAGWGVAIASRHPMERLGPELLTRPENAPPDTHIPDRAIRFVGALVNTPLGDVAMASVHLKCCGHDGSPEDLARHAEAQLINDTFETALGASATPLRIIGGDLNLVGSREPVDLLAEGLDADGSDLAIVEPWVLGDSLQYTWSDANSTFTPGRLDYVLIGDAALEVSRTFVLDTARLPPDVLAAYGLEARDSAATDHRPIVVDVRLAR